MNVSGIILAAGKGTRMNSELPKVLHTVLGKTLISYALSSLNDLDDVFVVVGHQHELVNKNLPGHVSSIHQKEQLGTGHAVSVVMQSSLFLKLNPEYTLVIPGDVPFISSEDINLLISNVKSKNALVGFLTATVSNPFGYGRVVKDDNTISIVEEKDATDDQKNINEINSGIYCFNTHFLIENISKLNTNNAQGEFYLTDLIAVANNQKQDIVIVQVDEHSIKGINSMSQLNEVEDVMQKKLIDEFMAQGVYFQDPATTYLEKNVKISSGTKIFANTHLTGTTSIAENCTIGPNTQINNSVVGKNSVIHNSVVDGAKVEDHGNIGPFAHIRQGSELGEGVKVGAFAETKESKIGKGSKVPHLAYVGDAELGENVNFSAGAITVNYDGQNKHKTVIKDGAFIGSDVMLVAPVTIGEDSMIAAGSVITKNVPAKALGIERNIQKNVDGYMDRKKKND